MMEDLLDKLQRARAQQLSDVLDVEDHDRKKTAQRIEGLKAVYEELELVAAAAVPATPEAAGPMNPNPAVLTADFYASYLLVVLLARNLNDARFLWKRIAAETKESSETLRNVGKIAKTLWQRDYAAAYAAMSSTWPASFQALVGAVRKSTREAVTDLLSVAYSTISYHDACHALGFEEESTLLAYIASLGWEVSATEQLIRPSPLPHVISNASSLEQLDSLSRYVLHLEQSTVVKF